MAGQSTFLLELGVIAGSALAFSLVAWRLHVPTAVGQLLSGIIIGPFGLKLVTDSTIIQAFADVGIVLLLFIVGLELDPLAVKALGSGVIVFSALEIAIAFVSVLPAGLLLGWSLGESFLLASVIAISSTALIARNLNQRKDLAESSRTLMVSALVVEDIVAVIILSLMPGLSAAGPLGPSIGSWTLRGIILVVVVGALGIYVAPRVIDRISQLDIDLDEAGFLLSLGLGFAMAIISSQIGFSAGTGAFLMGLVIRGKRARFVSEKLRPIQDLFLVIFFVSMGMLTDLSLLLSPLLVLPVSAMAVAGKYAGSYLGAILSKQRTEAGHIAVGMVPRGEFSLIIAREASSAGLARSIVYPLAGTVVLVTALVSSLVQIVKGSGLHPARTLWAGAPADSKEAPDGS